MSQHPDDKVSRDYPLDSSRTHETELDGLSADQTSHDGAEVSDLSRHVKDSGVGQGRPLSLSDSQEDPADTVSEEVRQLASKIKSISTNELGELLPAILGLGALSPVQLDFILQHLRTEVVRRFRAADLPTGLQAALHLLNFAHSTSQQYRFDAWAELMQATKANARMSQKGIIVCLAAGKAAGNPAPVQAVQEFLSGIIRAPDRDLQTSDWVLLLENLARLRFSPGSDVLLRLYNLAKEGILEGSKDGMPAKDVSYYIGDVIWAVVQLLSPSYVPQLLGPLLEGLQARKADWTMLAVSKLFAGLAYASALAEPLVAQMNLKDLRSEDLDGEASECLAHAYLSLPALAKYMPHAALVSALTFQKQKLAGRQENEQAKAEVSRVLSSLGIANTAGLPLVEGLLSVDIAIAANKTALMLPSSALFCANLSSQPLASTLLEWQILGTQGWKVVAIPVMLWEMQNSTDEQISLLRKGIQGPTAIEVYGTLTAMMPKNLLEINLPSLASKQDEASGTKQFSSGQSSDLGLPDAKHTQPHSARSNLSNQDSAASTHAFSPRAVFPTLPSSSSARSELIAMHAHSLQSDIGSDQRPSRAGSLPGNTQVGSLTGSQPLQPHSSLASFPSMSHGMPEDSQNQQSLAEQLSLAERFAAMNVDPQLGSSLASQSQSSMPVPLHADHSGNLPSFLPGGSLPQYPTAGLIPPSLGVPQNVPGAHGLDQMSSRLSNVSDLSSLANGPPLSGLDSRAFMSHASLPLNSIASSPAIGMPPGQKGIPGGGLQMRSSMPAKSGDLRSLWQMVTQRPDHTQPLKDTAKRGASVADLKRVIDMLPLETSAVSAVANRLAQLTPDQFAFLLTELARDNHAFRAWQLFDWVRALPEDNELRNLCDAHTYTTMISLCGPWQQVRRALSLVADMKQRSLQCGIQAYSALLNAAVKCGEVDLAVDVYRQMGQEGMARDRHIFQTMVDIFVKMGRHSDALGVLDDMKASGQQVEVQLYNLIVLSCTKLNNPKAALDVYKRMAENGVQPNTKTFTALIGSVGKMSTLEQAMEIIEQLLSHEKDTDNLTTTYSALMSACEKAGQWDLAVALFDKMSSQGCKPDVSIFNSMIAACAHGGEYVKARFMFERMAEHGCTAEAVTYANLIRAYKKGGQWCHALDTFEAMQRSGCGPHAAVFSSIIDVLWQTGIAWAQAKALELFKSAVKQGKLAGAAESCKKGTLKVDLQALTVGVAVLSMASWLNGARQASARDKAGSLDSARKLAIVNGLGEHSRAQGHSAAVKEAVGAGLLGCKAPFRLVQDHSRSGRLESSTLALRKWLFSEAFDAYYSLIHGGPDIAAQQMMTTEQYLKKEVVESEHCFSLFKRIQRYESSHPVTFKLLHNQPGNYLAIRKQLVSLTLQYALALQLSQETAHTALALMDRCVLAGMQVPDHLQPVLVCTCLRVAAIQESAYLPTPFQVQTVTQIPAASLEHMENTFLAALQGDTECISAVHCLKTYLQRLGVDLSNGKAVKLAAGCAFALATHALAELPIMQFTPSLTAAAVLVAARKAQGSVPFWPSVLSQMTGFTEASTPAFASALSHAERLCSKLSDTEDAPSLSSESMWGSRYQQL